MFSIDDSVENSSKLMTYDNTNLIDAMFSMADNWGCDCWVTDHVIDVYKRQVQAEVTANMTSMAGGAAAAWKAVGGAAEREEGMMLKDGMESGP